MHPQRGTNFSSMRLTDEFWEEGSTLQHFKSIAVPTLHVVGWWDAEILGGALDLYKQIEQYDRDEYEYDRCRPMGARAMVRGPSDRLGPYRFGSDTVAFYQKEIEVPFFAFHLKDKGDYAHPEAFMFQSGSNEWKKYTHWPPQDQVEKIRFYCHADGTLRINWRKSQSNRLQSLFLIRQSQFPIRNDLSWVSGKGYPIPKIFVFERAGIFVESGGSAFRE